MAHKTRQQQFAAFSPIADDHRARLRRLRDEIALDIEARAKRRDAIERARTLDAYDESWKIGVRPLTR
jgi:hypothetical protein